MAKSKAINPNVPANSEDRNYGATRIRGLAAAVAEYLNIDHYVGADGGSGYTEDAAGEHKKVTLRVNDTTPSYAEGKGVLYTKDVDGVLELFFRGETGNVVQLTSDGGNALNIAALSALANNTYLQAYNKAGDGSVNLIKAGRNEADDADVVVVPDKIRTATNAPPTEDTQIPNRKYVVDKVTADIATAIAGLSAIPRIKTGKYTGNNASSRSITGVGFRPKIVIIYEQIHNKGGIGDSSIDEIYIKTDQDGLYTKSTVGAWEDDIITSLDADGFSLGNDPAKINENGRAYTYICIGF